MIDVVVAITLFSVMFLAVGRFVVNLTDSSSVALERAHVRRELVLASAQLSADFAHAKPCDALTGVSGVYSVNDPDLGPNSAVVYTDVDSDGDQDLVAWRVQFSYEESSTLSVPATTITTVRQVATGPLQRAVVLNTAGCSALSAASLSWDTVLSSVSADETQVVFQPRDRGAATADAGRCLRVSDCQFDQLQVRFMYQSRTSGPVPYKEAFTVAANANRL